MCRGAGAPASSPIDPTVACVFVTQLWALTTSIALFALSDEWSSLLSSKAAVRAFTHEATQTAHLSHGKPGFITHRLCLTPLLRARHPEYSTSIFSRIALSAQSGLRFVQSRSDRLCNDGASIPPPPLSLACILSLAQVGSQVACVRQTKAVALPPTTSLFYSNLCDNVGRLCYYSFYV